jgi:alcohol dehydrogenase class IV
VYDPELVVTMPPALAGTSGMNAMAHSVEALYAKDANPVISLMAGESIRALGSALPHVVGPSPDIEAWTEAFYGAWLAGICLGAVGMALHHKLCHTLGGTFNLDHAGIHAVMLPYSAAYNRAALPRDTAEGLYDLLQKLGAKKSLREFGLSHADLEHAADLAVKNPYYNPRPVTRDGVLELLKAAYDGRRPE